EDPANAPLETPWFLTKSPQQAPDRAQRVRIGFESGVPISVDGQRLDAVSVVELLNEVGVNHAIGRVDLVEIRLVGIKSRGCYESPGGTLLLAAHRELEALCLDRDLMHFKQHVALKYAELIYYGLWFTPLRESLEAFVASTQKNVTGSVTLELYKGNITVINRESEHSFDRRLLPEEVAASSAYARALAKAGILSNDELISILQALEKIENYCARNPACFDESEAEDVHHFVEQHVVEAIGDAGYKLHTGR